MTAVLVLNTTHEPLHTVSVQHAIGMLWRGVAVVLEEGPDYFGPVLKPKVLILVRYVKERWKYGKRKTGKPKIEKGIKVTWENFQEPTAPYSLENLKRRDNEQCAYCGQPGAGTMDHVIPKSRGGATWWDNAVLACGPCNWDKADRTPAEAGMTLLWEPFVPTTYDLTWTKGPSEMASA